MRTDGAFGRIEGHWLGYLMWGAQNRASKPLEDSYDAKTLAARSWRPYFRVGHNITASAGAESANVIFKTICNRSESGNYSVQTDGTGPIQANADFFSSRIRTVDPE